MIIGLISGTIPIKTKISQEKQVDTPYGKPSSPLKFFSFGKNKFIHINRHSLDHTIPPHLINNQANISALKQEGAEKIIGLSSSGIINTKISPGTIVIPHDLIDLDHPTIYQIGDFRHTSLEEPFCPEMRKALINTLKKLKIPSSSGVIICPHGPSFETPAEIQAFKNLGADIVNMTTTGEAIISRELGICYASVCTADNFATGVGKSYQYSDIKTGAQTSVKQITKLLENIIFTKPPCPCPTAPEKGKV